MDDGILYFQVNDPPFSYSYGGYLYVEGRAAGIIEMPVHLSILRCVWTTEDSFDRYIPRCSPALLKYLSQHYVGAEHSYFIN